MSRSVTINLLLVAIGIALLWLLTWPLLERSQELRSSRQVLKNEIVAEQEAVAKIAQIEDDLGTHQEALDRLELAIPAKRDIASALAVFEEVANANGLVLSNVQLNEKDEPRAKKSTVETINVILKLEGRYGSLQSFLKDIEATFPLMDVAGLSFLIPKKTGEAGEETLINPVLEITLSLDTYHR